MKQLRFYSWLFILLFCAGRVHGQDHAFAEEPPVINAAKDGDNKQVHLLLHKGASPDTSDEEGRTALMWTALWVEDDAFLLGNEELQVEAARTLLAAGAKIDAADREGKTALIHAVGCRHPLLTKVFLDAGANVNHRDRLGRSALTFAAHYRSDYDDFVRSLLAKGLRMNGIEALMLADLPKAYALMHRQADRLAHGPNRETALMMAALYGDLKLVRWLLSRGANINARDERGYTALMLAVGATPPIRKTGSQKWNEVGTTAGREAIIAALLAKQARVDSRDEAGNTPLLWAIEQNQKGIVRQLLRGGAKVNLINYEGQTPLQWAKQKKNQAITAMLLRAGAKEIVYPPIKPVTLTLKDQPLQEALRLVCDRAGADYVLELDVLSDLPVTCTLEKQTIQQAVAKVLAAVTPTPPLEYAYDDLWGIISIYRQKERLTDQELPDFRLTLRIRHSDLYAATRAILHTSGFAFSLNTSLRAQPASLSLKNVPFSNTFKKLVQLSNPLLIYKIDRGIMSAWTRWDIE